MHLLSQMTPAEAEAILYDWTFWARKTTRRTDGTYTGQQPPPGHWYTWLIMAGRGYGKTRTGAEQVRRWVEHDGVRRLAFVGRTAADVRDVMVEGESGILNISPPWFRPHYEPSKRRLTWPNGAMATLFSADEPNLLRGPQHEKAWCLAGDTLVLMADGSQKPISSIHIGDRVQTRKGCRKVIFSGMTKQKAQVYLLKLQDGRTIIGTSEHKFWVAGQGFLPLGSLSRGMSVCVTHVSNGTGRSGTDAATAITQRRSGFTGKFGRWLTVQFLPAIMSTTVMATKATTGLRIWNFLRMANIVRSTTKKSWLRIGKKLSATHRKPKDTIDSGVWSESLSAWFAAGNIGAEPRIRPNSVHKNVLMPRVITHSRVKQGCVNIAVRNTQPPNGHSDIALGNVMPEPATQGWPHSKTVNCLAKTVVKSSHRDEPMPVFAAEIVPLVSMPIQGVEKLTTPFDVYDITVEDAGEFFANGIVVHNCDEPAAWRYAEAWDQLTFGLRLGNNPQIVATTTPRPIKLIRDLIAEPDTVVTRGSTYENRANLSPKSLEKFEKKYAGTRLGRQELYAVLLLDMPGALWTLNLIDRDRVRESPELKRIVVAVDPATTATEESSETGIIVGALCKNNHGYVLEDATLTGSPHEWATAAIEAFDRWQADRIVIEVNQGGDMVEHTLRTVRRDVPIKQVRATRGKQTRAEPISALYEQGLIHHVGAFPELEDQMTTWVPGEDSPDRMDALVWCMTELMPVGSANATEPAVMRGLYRPRPKKQGPRS